jgi:hypothetical protein
VEPDTDVVPDADGPGDADADADGDADGDADSDADVAGDADVPDGWIDGRPADLEDNIWTWWAHPLAVNDGARSWVGGIASDGDVRITRVGADASLETVVVGNVSPDDHSGPAIAFGPEQPDLLVFFAGHNSEDVVHYRRLGRDTLSLGDPEELSFSGNVTYAQALVRGDRIVLVTRVSLSTWRYRMSEDFGDTWTAERVLIDATGYGQVYGLVKPILGQPSRAQLAFYGHPENSEFRDVLHGVIDLDTGRITTVGGADLGDLDSEGGPGLLPVPPDGAPGLETAISPSTGYAVRLLDVGTLGGLPAILYVVWTGDEAPHYRVKLRRESGEWSSAPWMPPTGSVFGYRPDTHYHGGAVFARADSVFSSREEGGQWRVERWDWDPATADLVLAGELSATARPVVRPYVPYHDGLVDVIAHELLRYEAYTDYLADTRFLAP